MSFTSMLADAASTLSTAVGDVLEEASAEFSASGLSLVTVGGRTVQPRRVLAEGGFSCVYKAVDEGGAAFALKRMVCQDRTTKVVAKRELKALRHLAGHKNVVKLLGFTSRQDGGGAVEAYFLFPLYASGTVFDHMWAWLDRDDDAKRRAGTPWPFDERRALRVARGVASALAALHALKWAHRDVKPHNVLLSDRGTPLLTDFGSVANARVPVPDRKAALALQDEAMSNCSAPYRAPELYEPPTGPGCFVDARVDVWSLGATLFALAYGHCPFEPPGQGVSTMGVINGRYAFPRSKSHGGCDFSEGFERVVALALDTDSANRPDIAEYAAALDAAAAGKPLPPRAAAAAAAGACEAGEATSAAGADFAADFAAPPAAVDFFGAAAPPPAEAGFADFSAPPAVEAGFADFSAPPAVEAGFADFSAPPAVEAGFADFAAAPAAAADAAGFADFGAFAGPPPAPPPQAAAPDFFAAAPPPALMDMPPPAASRNPFDDSPSADAAAAVAAAVAAPPPPQHIPVPPRPVVVKQSYRDNLGGGRAAAPDAFGDLLSF